MEKYVNCGKDSELGARRKNPSPFRINIEIYASKLGEVVGTCCTLYNSSICLFIRLNVKKVNTLQNSSSLSTSFASTLSFHARPSGSFLLRFQAISFQWMF